MFVGNENGWKREGNGKKRLNTLHVFIWVAKLKRLGTAATANLNKVRGYFCPVGVLLCLLKMKRKENGQKRLNTVIFSHTHFQLKRLRPLPQLI